MSQIKVDSIVPRGGIPSGADGGGIIQTVFEMVTADFSTANDDAYNDITGMSATITPSSSSSKILITVCMTHNVSSNSNILFRLIRGSSTTLGNYTGSLSGVGTSGAAIAGGKYDAARGNPTTFKFLDSPSTTSSTSYKIQEYHNAGTFVLNGLSGNFTGSSSITLQEVSG